MINFKKLISKYFILFCEHTGRFGLVVGLSYKYYFLRGRLPNFINPKNLSEWILCSMIKKSFLNNADYADKVKVREYVVSKGLGKILLQHYATWEDAKDISINELPQKFILKPNNGSGGHVICRDKNNFDIDEYREFLNENLRRGKNYFFEPHYRKINPRILCEELIDLGPGKFPIDYKFTCINGNIVDIFIAIEDQFGKRKYCTMNTKWEQLNYTKKEYLPDQIPPKPNKFDEMTDYAKILSSEFIFVRVDLYEYNDNIYFGELTFSPWGGLMYSYTDESLELLGRMLH